MKVFPPERLKMILLIFNSFPSEFLFKNQNQLAPYKVTLFEGIHLATNKKLALIATILA